MSEDDASKKIEIDLDEPIRPTPPPQAEGTDFLKQLDSNANVDDIFKDIPTPPGADPFMQESVAIVDNDKLFCINRKFAAIQSLFTLINRDYLSFGQLMSEILRIAVEHVKSEAGSILEVDHKRKILFFRAVAGRSSENLLNFEIALNQGIAGFVCENQQPLILSSLTDNQKHLKMVSQAIGFETNNIAAYPIIIRGTTFGCLELLNRVGQPDFSEADQDVLQTITEYAAKVIENRLILACLSKAKHNEDQAA